MNKNLITIKLYLNSKVLAGGPEATELLTRLGVAGI